jgi:PIN domain nuclease of toxin-antitoxin system
MAMRYVVDTHALIWQLEGSSRLGLQAKAILLNPLSDLVLPAIALAEAVWTVERGKTGIPSALALVDAVKADRRFTIYPLDQRVIEQTLTLAAINEMHDRQIVATALVLQRLGADVALLSCDQNIKASQTVPIIW